MDVRAATTGEDPVLARTLALAFEDDPVQAHLVRGDRRLHRIGLLFRMELRGLHGRGRVLTTDARDGAALWAAPGRWETPLSEVLRALPDVWRAFGAGAPRALDTLRRIEAAHPAAPHWYLAILGTAPAAQGRGVGSALLRPVLDECDRTGTPAYLESSRESNVPWYARHGFEVTGRIDLPDGPSLWPMWREAR